MRLGRRAVLQSAVGAALAGCAGRPSRVAPPRAPEVPFGVQTGEVTPGRAVVWSRADRDARMVVEWSLREDFANPRRVEGLRVTADTDFTGHLLLEGLPDAARIHYRVVFDDAGRQSERVVGSFRSAPRAGETVTFAWSADTCGQGFGIDRARGGFRIYDTILRQEPDFFVHAGDLIYADSPVLPEMKLDDGTVLRHVVTPAKSKVAETQDEFRGQFQYNLLDDNVRRMNARVAQLVMWDDHETHNNWFPGQLLDDARYTEKRASVLAARARRAMFEYTPIVSASPAERERVYRHIPYGPRLDVFLLDERSYRGKNTRGLEDAGDPDAAFLGRTQLAWLKEALVASRTTWKVVVTDMPLALVVTDARKDAPHAMEAWANGDDGPPRGREHELADLLAHLKAHGVRGVVFLTADVHYCAAHRFDPSRAVFKDFDAFHEFVAGPMQAGTFGPNDLDPTFGPEVLFQKAPPKGKANLAPILGMQFFGTVRIDGITGTMTVALWDVAGTKLYEIELEAPRQNPA